MVQDSTTIRYFDGGKNRTVCVDLVLHLNEGEEIEMEDRFSQSGGTEPRDGIYIVTKRKASHVFDGSTSRFCIDYEAQRQSD